MEQIGDFIFTALLGKSEWHVAGIPPLEVLGGEPVETVREDDVGEEL